MTEKYLFYDEQNDTIRIESTQEAREWLLYMLDIALTLNDGNRSVQELIVEESKECKLSGVDEELC